jgi:hypothetical protein
MSKGYVYGIWLWLILIPNATNGIYEPILDENNPNSRPNEKMNKSILAW